MNPRSKNFLAACMLPLVGAAGAQTFTKADSGWTPLFNGTDFTGFYSRNYGATVQPVRPVASPYIIQFAGTDSATIRVNATSPGGNFGTDDTTFSHYRVRWESKYDAINPDYNSGMMYHVDEKAIRMQNNWPRSIEFQGKQSEIGSAFSIQQVTFTTNATGGEGSNYSPTAPVKQGCEFGCNGRWYKGNPLIRPYAAETPNVPRWVRFHLVVRGADSAIHIVNDTTVFRLWNIRIFNDSTRGTASNKTPNRPHDHGGMGWQSEGAIVNYRRLEVMRIPPATPMSAHYLHRLFLDAPAQASKPAPGAQVPMTWRSIGAIPKVKIEYRVGEGRWQVAQDSVPNTGSFTWTAPASVPDSINWRISSLDYVWGDSTSVSLPASLKGRAFAAQGPLYAVKGGGLLIPGSASLERVEIRDVSGRLLRALQGGPSEIRWDLSDAKGARVSSGLYFLRLIDGQADRVARVRVD